MSYAGSDDEEIEMVLGNNLKNNWNYNVVNDSGSDDKVEKKLFEDQIKEEIEVAPRPHSFQKWWEQWKICKLLKMKMLTKLLKNMHKKRQHKKFRILIDLSTITIVMMDTVPVEDKP